jgi:GxxExxY protein
MRVTSNINVLTREIIGAHIEVRRELGPRLLESIYASCVHRELNARGLHFEHQRSIAVVYKGDKLQSFYRVDLIVEGLIVVELKAADHVLPVHEAQVLTYLKLTGCPLGLLINFNVAKLSDGVKRFVNPGRRQFIGSDIEMKP